jgi:hypothetical protein
MTPPFDAEAANFVESSAVVVTMVNGARPRRFEVVIRSRWRVTVRSES